MGLWIFMLIIVLFIPAIMILFGALFKKSVPVEINYVFCYRTNMSMKNKDTWEFAHKFLGKLWFRLGWLLLPVTIVPMLFVMGKSEDTIGTVGTIVSFVDLALLMAPIIPTERALRKNFDKDGNRKVE